MKWAKTVKYQTTLQVGRILYNVRCESDFDDGFSVYVNNEFVSDVEKLPTEEELVQIISDNLDIESTIKHGLASAGVFE